MTLCGAPPVSSLKIYREHGLSFVLTLPGWMSPIHTQILVIQQIGTAIGQFVLWSEKSEKGTVVLFSI
jgi:hypothetical protein